LESGYVGTKGVIPDIAKTKTLAGKRGDRQVKGRGGNGDNGGEGKR